MKKISLIICALGVLFFWTGCQSPKTAGMSAKISMNGQESKIIQASSGVSDKIAILSAPSGYTADHFLIAQVELQSIVDRDFSFQYRFNWYDANGMEIYPGKALWMSHVIHGKETINLQSVSPYSTAASFKISIRPID